MKAIQITINDELLLAIDRMLKGKKRRRSAFIRQSLANELKRLKRVRLEAADRRGYRASPVLAGEFDIPSSQRAWGDEWQPRRRSNKQ